MTVQRTCRRDKPCVAGFTLVEVLVAIAITSTALIAGLKAAMALTHNAERQSVALLSQLCAHNELANIRLSRTMPPMGISTVDCEQAGQTFTLQVSVTTTANPNFRRVDVRPTGNNAPGSGLWTLVGQY